MESLKSSMEWDEQTFGLEYDLDVFNIVAVAHAGGAMENKSLNIFSTGLVVASPLTNTDASMEAVMRVIAHECAPCPVSGRQRSGLGSRLACVRCCCVRFFHNWTGNRITCRDWFQLTLKEVRQLAICNSNCR